MGENTRDARVTSFLKGFFERKQDLPLDASLKARIARSLVNRICRDPEQGVSAVQELLDKISSLQDHNRMLEEITLTDPLTGAHNERYLQRIMDEFQSDTHPDRRSSGRHFIVMIDLDGFKHINDAYGHECGNVALKHVVKKLSSLLRKSDDICRIGGDEFVIILKNATQEGAHKKIIQISDAFDEMSFVYEGMDIPVRASLGWTEMEAKSFLKDIMKKIDDYVYEAKEIKGDTRFARLVIPGISTQDRLSA